MVHFLLDGYVLRYISPLERIMIVANKQNEIEIRREFYNMDKRVWFCDNDMVIKKTDILEIATNINEGIK